jgi:hypothetical protein
MKIGIVGSRDYPLEAFVRAFVRGIHARVPDAIIVSGGARGVDTWAADEARKCGMQVEVHPADWEGRGRGAGLERNSVIVARSQLLVAFWNGVSRGTVDSIRKARRAGKRVTVIGLDGGRVPIESLG